MCIVYFGGEEAENAERGYLRLEQGGYLARKNDDVFVGNATAEKRDVELEKFFLFGGLDGRDDEIPALKCSDGDILRRGLDGPVAFMPVLVDGVVFK
jgi:hypothetical protein